MAETNAQPDPPTGAGPTDAELGSLIARGDWVGDVTPPTLTTVIEQVARRRRRRRTVTSAGAAVACAAAVAAVVSLPLHSGDSTGPAPATQPPATTRQVDGHRPPSCVTDLLLMAQGTPTPGTAKSGTHTSAATVLVENLGDAACTVSLPSVRIGSSTFAVRADTDGVAREWTLEGHEALYLTVSPPRHRSCTRGSAPSTSLILRSRGWGYLFPIQDMRVVGCSQPPVLEAHVAHVGD